MIIEVICMSKKKKEKKPLDAWKDPWLNPEERIAPEFDSTGIKKFYAPEPGEMGFRVLDNCAEDHEM